MMNDSADLTVVIPVHNRERLLAECLASVAAQTARGFRLIVVDNSSTDRSRAVAEDWGRRHLDIPLVVLDEPRPGCAAARNCGLAAVDTPWTLFFDSDDLMHPDHLRRVIAAIRRMPGTEVIGWPSAMSQGPDAGRRHEFADRPRSRWWDLMFAGTFSTQRYCARTALFRAAGGWNEGLAIWEDLELGARILARRPRVRVLDGRPTVLVRHTAVSVTGESYRAMLPRIEASLEAVRPVMPAEKAVYCDVRRAIMYGYAEHESPGAGRALMNALAGRTPSVRHRAFMRAAYAFYSCGLRGGARILKPLRFLL